jgi:AhpD family alkylhydroperoxidase
METRFKMAMVLPDAYKALISVDQVVESTSLSKAHQELIKIRASQINGCAYCVNMHTNDAREIGENDNRMHLINVWKEAGSIFTVEEQLLFKITEEITLISDHGLSKKVYNEAITLFGEEATSAIIMAIIAINSWNRVAVSLRMQPTI